ncbi:MAG TPA: hypothetical protein VKA49_00725 [Flavitalea sp.]|nr:hypothetical protein [Flavitalea sp.]
MMAKPLMILIAGPYRSGTNDDSSLIAANVEAMSSMAWKVYKKGHLPVLGEWFALPLIERAGSTRIGDPIFNDIFHPVAIQLLLRCDAVLRIGGASSGADDMVQVGRENGKLIFHSLDEVPTNL